MRFDDRLTDFAFFSPEVPGLHPGCLAFGTEIFQPVDHDVDHAAATFEFAMCEPGAGSTTDLVVTLPDVRLEDQISRSRFIFESHKCNPLGRGGPLPEDHQPGNPALPAIDCRHQISRSSNSLLIELCPAEGQWMSAKRQAY
jgi:hypothetical protein